MHPRECREGRRRQNELHPARTCDPAAARSIVHTSILLGCEHSFNRFHLRKRFRALLMTSRQTCLSESTNWPSDCSLFDWARCGCPLIPVYKAGPLAELLKHDNPNLQASVCFWLQGCIEARRVSKCVALRPFAMYP
jgi:hypothetical protein